MSWFWGITRTIQGIGSARVLVPLRVITHVYKHVYMRWRNATHVACSRTIKKQKRLTNQIVTLFTRVWIMGNRWNNTRHRKRSCLSSVASSHARINTRIYRHVYEQNYICDDARNATHVACSRTTPKTETTSKTLHFSLCLGFGESLEQCKASEALVSWLHCVITNIYIYKCLRAQINMYV